MANFIKDIISINQRAAIEFGLDLDIIDLAIYDYIKSFILSRGCMRIDTDEGPFYWVSHQNIQDGMPLLGIKSSQGIINRVSKLINAGLLIKYSKCDTIGKTVYALGPNYDRLEFFETPQQNLRVPPTKVEDNNILFNIPSVNDSKESITSPKGEVDELFEKFWNLYGKKSQRAQAERMWKRLTKADKDEVLSRVAAYVASTPDVQYRMNPATYLNPTNKRWLDEIIDRNAPKQQDDHVFRMFDEKPKEDHVWRV